MPNFYHLLYDPNTGFRYIFGQFRVCVFEKNPLLHRPISAENAISRAIKEEHWCTNKLAVNCFQKPTDYVVPLSSRNLAFVNRMIVAINHRNNYSSSFPSSSLLSQLAGLCQLPQTTLPSQYLWILNESTNIVLEAKIQRILLTLKQGASFTLPGLHWLPLIKFF